MNDLTTTDTWYVLVCLCCDGDDPADWLPMPFESPQARGRWAAAHTQGTGHDRWRVLDQPKDAG